MADSKIETELRELIDTVMIACNPPDSCKDPAVLKKYMRACLKRAEKAQKILTELKRLKAQIRKLKQDIENRKDYASYLQGHDGPMHSYNWWLKNKKETANG